MDFTSRKCVHGSRSINIPFSAYSHLVSSVAGIGYGSTMILNRKKQLLKTIEWINNLVSISTFAVQLMKMSSLFTSFLYVSHLKVFSKFTLIISVVKTKLKEIVLLSGIINIHHFVIPHCHAPVMQGKKQTKWGLKSCKCISIEKEIFNHFWFCYLLYFWYTYPLWIYTHNVFLFKI